MRSLRDLSFGRASFTLTPAEPVRLQPFLGSTLRGALGHALRAVVGDEGRDARARLTLADRCPYLSVFGDPETDRALGRQGVGRPYVLRAPPISTERWSPERPLEFGLVLLGRAQLALPWMIAAVERMAREGFGPGRSTFELTSVLDVDGAELWRPGEPARLAPEEVGEDLRGEGEAELTLRLLSPLSLAEKGRLVEPTPRALLRAAFRRLERVVVEACDGAVHPDDWARLNAAAEVVEVTAVRLEPHRQDRYSSRQRQTQRWPTWRGEVDWAGPSLIELAPLLRAMEVLHVGRKTAFGLGRVQVIARGSVRRGGGRASEG